MILTITEIDFHEVAEFVEESCEFQKALFRKLYRQHSQRIVPVLFIHQSNVDIIIF